MTLNHPPEPKALGLMRRLRLTMAGVRDRHLHELPPDGRTPMHMRLMTESQKGELDVASWLVPYLVTPDTPEPEQSLPTTVPNGYPPEIWEARLASRAAREHQAAQQRGVAAVESARAAHALACAAVGRWIAHYQEQASRYDRARLGAQSRVPGWTIPTYTFVTALHEDVELSPIQLKHAAITEKE